LKQSLPPLSTLTVNAPSENYFYSKVVEAQEGETAFSVFSRAVEMHYKNYSFGAYVYSVQDINESASEGFYWQYYFNGALAPLGVSDFKIIENGTLEWRLEKPDMGAFS